MTKSQVQVVPGAASCNKRIQISAPGKLALGILRSLLLQETIEN